MWLLLKGLALRFAIGRTVGGMLTTLFVVLLPIAGILKFVGLPLLIVLGAPVTLALQAGSRPTQQRILRVLHSAPARVLTHPLTVWVLFGSTLVVLYFTPLYELSLRNEWVHAAVHIHFVVVGSLFGAGATRWRCWSCRGRARRRSSRTDWRRRARSRRSGS